MYSLSGNWSMLIMSNLRDQCIISPLSDLYKRGVWEWKHSRVFHLSVKIIAYFCEGLFFVFPVSCLGDSHIKSHLLSAKPTLRLKASGETKILINCFAIYNISERQWVFYLEPHIPINDYVHSYIYFVPLRRPHAPKVSVCRALLTMSSNGW